MQTLNRYVGGRQEVGHIDLLDTISYFEVPEKDARKVMTQLTGIRYHGRQVRCNDADDDRRPANSMPKGEKRSSHSSQRPAKDYKRSSQSSQRYSKDYGKSSQSSQKRGKKHSAPDGFIEESGDWRQFFGQKGGQLVGAEPDFSEEGWARRYPKKKK